MDKVWSCGQKMLLIKIVISKIILIFFSILNSINSTWITFNKPKESTNTPNELVEHGGFLMALGLNGHLSKLGKLESFDYLVRFK